MSSFLGSETCGETCSDEDLCGSFVSAVDPASTCDAGCVPASALEMCDRLCTNGDAGGADGPVAVQQRQGIEGLFGSFTPTSSSPSVLSMTTDLACANCAFYQCCVGDEGYEACQSKLPNVEDFVPEIEALDPTGDFEMQDLVDALMPENWESMLSDEMEQLGGIFDIDPEMTSGIGNDLDLEEIFSWNATDWDVLDWDVLDWEGIGEFMGPLADGLHSLLDEAAAEMTALDADMTAISALNLECDPAACPVDGLCEAAGTGLDPSNLDLSTVDFDEVCASNALFLCTGELEGACDERCDGDVSDDSASFCALCQLARCCNEGGETASFQDCASESVSQAAESMAAVLDSAMEGISEALEGMALELADAVEVFVADASTPDICPKDGVDACPVVEGFCDIFDGEATNFDLSTVNFEQACNDNAFLLCAPEGFDDMCAEKCSGETGSDVTLAVARSVALELNPQDAFCTICGVATCCRDKDADSTFEDCVSVHVPSWGLSEDSGASSEVPVAETLEPSVQDGESEADSSAEATNSAPASASSEGNIDSSVEAYTDLEPTTEAVDVQEPSVSTEPPVIAAAELERTDLPESGSSISVPSILIALASAVVYALL